ncbi:hypothetical protein IFVP5_C1420081 [Vibrio parahaemolyticus]|nr:hypothetical protein D036_2850 [Vibrio parahaemolyticus VP232]
MPLCSITPYARTKISVQLSYVAFLIRVADFIREPLNLNAFIHQSYSSPHTLMPTYGLYRTLGDLNT